jgi:Na+/H+ antiporter NhaD/arsenite permease-like protein
MDASVSSPHPLMMGPFVLLLGLIALAPLIFNAWWQRHYAKVALGLGAVTLLFYLRLPQGPEHVEHTAVEYLSFIALIGSLFVVSGGIHITVKGEATPLANVMFLAVGAVIANLLGTTGASMLLIRPWIRMNKYRITAYHIVFFIFLVSNVGGCLTPIGDPPLFLGYLKGVPFWWVAWHCWPMWLVGVGLLLAMFFVIDRQNYLRAPKEVRARLAEPPDTWRFQGLHNLAFLGVILGSVFIQHPHFLRELLMIAASVGSYYTTRPAIHQVNHFNFHPIREVALLFAGIFATMIPALDYLQTHADFFGAPAPGTFFWDTGILSSFLDNAPTYLSFLSTEFGAFATPELQEQIVQHLRLHGTQLGMVQGPAGEDLRQAVGVLAEWYGSRSGPMVVSEDQIRMAVLLGDPLASQILTAISVGAVFFGANTYIGNGPNFMVKSIADQQKVHTPTFLGYLFRYTVPYMLPVLLIVWWIFFHPRP